jgi:hypothetical protein
LDAAGSLFVGSPNQLTSGAVETQDGAVHVLQLHSSPNHPASRPTTTINSRSPLNKPIGTSCASLFQQVSCSLHPLLHTFKAFLSRDFLFVQGYTVSGMYLIKPTAHSGAPFPIYCNMQAQGGGWSMCYTSDGIGDVDMFGDYAYSDLRPYGRRCGYILSSCRRTRHS